VRAAAMFPHQRWRGVFQAAGTCSPPDSGQGIADSECDALTHAGSMLHHGAGPAHN
jgi:hypothetical protein